MIEYAYYNGTFTPYNSAVIPLSDRAIFFSDAVYDVVVGKGKKVYQLDEHLDRLVNNAKRIGLDNLPDKSEVSSVVKELLELSDADEFMLYIQLSADSDRRTHSRMGTDANILMTLTDCKLPQSLGKIKAITLPDMRHGYCDVKTTSLLPAVLSVEEAARRGADIAIFHKGGYVTECSYANVAILHGGTVITHPYDSDILPGITQRNLESVCRRLGIPNEREIFTKEVLYEADAVMISSTTKLIKLCTEIDGIPLTVKGSDTVKLLFDELLHDLADKTQ